MRAREAPSCASHGAPARRFPTTGRPRSGIPPKRASRPSPRGARVLGAALRIAVNDELAELERVLPRAVARLREDGRLAVISFHSLEDRIVKQFVARASKPWGGDPRLARVPIVEADLPEPPLAPVGRAIKPTDAECDANPRARSAVLRVARRTGAPLPSDWP